MKRKQSQEESAPSKKVAERKRGRRSTASERSRTRRGSSPTVREGSKAPRAKQVSSRKGAKTQRKPATPKVPPTLGDLDLHLFGEGRHERIYEKLGAHVV